MSDVRTTRAKINIVASYLNQIVALVCGFVVPGILLRAFGSEVYGACASITQFLSYIALLEGGIGGVARAALYRPLAEDDMHAVSAILSEIQKFFRVILLIFGIYVLVLSCFFHSISRTETMDWLTTFWLVIVISISTFAQYFIGISNSVLLQAAQRSYVTSFINLLTSILNAVAVVVLVVYGCNILVVKLVSSLIYIMKPIAYWLYVKRTYHLTKVSRQSTTYLTQKWSGLGQHLAYFLHSNTDVVLLTFFADLKAVAVYSVYNMVISHIQNLAIPFTSGMEALFGDMLAQKESSTLHKTFNSYEMMISLTTVILFSVTAVLIVPFVKIYTGGISDAAYEAPLFALILIIASVLYCLRMPYHSMVIAAGHFKQTEIASYGEAVINVLVSIALVSRMGLVGVAIGTAVAVLFRFLFYVWYLSKHIFRRPMVLFGKRCLVDIAGFTVSFLLGRLLIANAQISNYGQWALWGVFITGASLVITLGLNVLYDRKTVKNLLNTVKTGKKDRR